MQNANIKSAYRQRREKLQANEVKRHPDNKEEEEKDVFDAAI